MIGTGPRRSTGCERKAKRHGGAGVPRGPIATYLRACARCGCRPAPGIAEDLAEHGALIVDLRLCSTESLQAICALLREAPGGIVQIVLRDGFASLGSDKAYCDRAFAHKKRIRKDDGPLDVAPMRLLVAALACFLAARSVRLQVLDLAGAPLGREVPTLLTPVATALRSARMRDLRWLNFSGCRLADRGLALLLPWLAGADNALPTLEALALAWNNFSDVRLVDALLRARARLCYERRAVGLRLLDLSGNPRLCDSSMPTVPTMARPASASARRRGGSGVAPRLGAANRNTGPNGKRRGALIKSISCALAEGLPLKVLRLKRMHLNEEAFQPLLHLMQTETRRCIASEGALASATGFCLEEINLDGNSLDQRFLEEIEDCLRHLHTIRQSPLQPIDMTDIYRATAPPQAVDNTSMVVAGEGPCRCQSSSAPASPSRPVVNGSAAAAIAASVAAGEGSPAGQRQKATLLSPLTAALLTRDALSDPGTCQDERHEDLGALAAVAAASREAFLLRRAEDRRHFRGAAAELAERRPRSLNSAFDKEAAAADPDAWLQPEMTIAGVLDGCAAHSLVRQAVLAELADVDALTAWRREALADVRAAATDAEMPSEHSTEEDDPRVNLEPSVEAVESVDEKAPCAFPLGEDSGDDVGDGEQAEIELLRRERLEALRADVIGALSPPLAFAPQPREYTPFDPLGCDAPRRGIRGVHGSAVPGSSGPFEPEASGLDAMYHEALAELRGRLLARDGAAAGPSHGIGHGQPAWTRDCLPGDWPGDPRVAAGG